MAERAVAIKLTVQEQEKVLAAMRAVGTTGEAEAKRLEAAFDRASKATTGHARSVGVLGDSLQTLKSPVGELTGNFFGMGGVIAGVATGLGGVAAAVGV